MVRCLDPFQLYGGSGAGERHRGIVESSAMAAAPFVRGAGTGRRIAGLHNRFRASFVGRMDAARLANALELSANAHRTAFCAVVPDPAHAHNSHGSDATSTNGRSHSAARKFRAGDRFPLWREHIGCGGRGCGRRSLLN